jgi:hypothetical protein
MDVPVPALVLPPWLEYTVTGTLVIAMLWMILGILDAYRRRQATDLGVDKRVLAQLDERNAYVERIEGRNEKDYERNVELTNQLVLLSTEYLAKATDFKNAMERAFSEIKVVREEVQDCKDSHKECTTRVEELSRMVAQVAVNAAPAERHTNVGP